MSHRVLVAEDDATTRYLIEQYCKEEPLDLVFAADGVTAMGLLKEQRFDIVVTDVRLPGITGEALLAFMHETRPEVPVIVITGFATVAKAVTAMKQGAFDFVGKPFTPDYIRIVVRRAVESERPPHALLLVGPSGVGKTYLAEVENRWIDGKCVQKHIRYIGREVDGETVLSSSLWSFSPPSFISP